MIKSSALDASKSGQDLPKAILITDDANPNPNPKSKGTEPY